ncbi:Spo0B domain-containing protein [Aquibacillus albus]|nr:Spo0B domain-containing protein [Aquibacillus albus]
MKEEDMIDLLRHYRHDWLNEVQLLMGYSSMGKLDKVQDKLKEVIEGANKERNLDRLSIPKTAIWLISFNWRYDNFRMDYQVETNNNLASYDDQIHNQLERLIKLFSSQSDEMELYHVKIVIKESTNKKGATELVLSISGTFSHIEILEKELVENQQLHKVNLSPLSNKKIQCTMTYICN